MQTYVNDNPILFPDKSEYFKTKCTGVYLDIWLIKLEASLQYYSMRNFDVYSIIKVVKSRL